MRAIITSHFVNDKDKDEKPYKTKKGEPFSKVTIKIAKDPKNPQEWDDKYISGLSFNPTDACLQWKIGDEVDITIGRNGEFWNFRTPTRLDRLENRIKTLEDFMLNGGEKLPAGMDSIPTTTATEAIKQNKEDLPVLEEDEEIPDNIPFLKSYHI